LPLRLPLEAVARKQTMELAKAVACGTVVAVIVAVGSLTFLRQRESRVRSLRTSVVATPSDYGVGVVLAIVLLAKAASIGLFAGALVSGIVYNGSVVRKLLLALSFFGIPVGLSVVYFFRRM